MQSMFYFSLLPSLLIIVIFSFNFSKTKSPTTKKSSKQEQCLIFKQMYLVERSVEIVNDSILEDVGGGEAVLEDEVFNSGDQSSDTESH